MKANAPEKIYIFEQDFLRKDHKIMYGVNQDKDIKGLIEYTRTDAFIEKAAKWINEHTSLSEKLVIENFVNYMKGE